MTNKKQFILTILMFIFVNVAIGQTDKKVNDTIAINNMYQEWGQAIGTKGAEGYASFFTNDAVLLPPDSKAVIGQDSIQKWMKNNLDTYSFQVTGFTQDEIRIGNGWAFMRVTITGTKKLKSGGKSVTTTNKYLDVLQRQTDGTWKFVYRMWNSEK